MFDSKKATQLLVYSIQHRGGMMDICIAMVIVWLSDRLHSRKYGCTITGDEYIVTEKGIFPSELNQMINKASFENPAIRLYFEKHLVILNGDFLKARDCFDNNILSIGEIRCICEICEAVNKLAKSEIVDMKNFFSEWSNSALYSDLIKCESYSINEIDFLLDVDIEIKSNKLIEIFTKEKPLNSDLSKSQFLPEGIQETFSNY